jgi:hypothetical protein
VGADRLPRRRGPHQRRAGCPRRLRSSPGRGGALTGSAPGPRAPRAMPARPRARSRPAGRRGRARRGPGGRHRPRAARRSPRCPRTAWCREARSAGRSYPGSRRRSRSRRRARGRSGPCGGARRSEVLGEPERAPWIRLARLSRHHQDDPAEEASRLGNRLGGAGPARSSGDRPDDEGEKEAAGARPSAGGRCRGTPRRTCTHAVCRGRPRAPARGLPSRQSPVAGSHDTEAPRASSPWCP